jgi:hypothetical protein
LDHAEGNDGARKRVTMSAGANEGVDVTSEIALRRRFDRKEKDHSYQKKCSRKGAEAQRKTQRNRRLCVFATLREIFFPLTAR